MHRQTCHCSTKAIVSMLLFLSGSTVTDGIKLMTLHADLKCAHAKYSCTALLPDIRSLPVHVKTQPHMVQLVCLPNAQAHAPADRQTGWQMRHLEVFIFLALPVQSLPHVIRLVCRHVGVDGSFSRRRQRRVENGGNGNDAHILRRLQILPVIHHQMMAIEAWIQSCCVDTCAQKLAYVKKTLMEKYRSVSVALVLIWSGENVYITIIWKCMAQMDNSRLISLQAVFTIMNSSHIEIVLTWQSLTNQMVATYGTWWQSNKTTSVFVYTPGESYHEVMTDQTDCCTSLAAHASWTSIIQTGEEGRAAFLWCPDQAMLSWPETSLGSLIAWSWGGLEAYLQHKCYGQLKTELNEWNEQHAVQKHSHAYQDEEEDQHVQSRIHKCNTWSWHIGVYYIYIL